MPKLVYSLQFTVHSKKQKQSPQATVNREPKTDNRKSAGFTLVELLVAITILAILTGVGTVSFNNALDKGRDNKRKQDVASIKGALALYFQDNGYYPCDVTPPTACTKTAFASDAGANWIPNLTPTYIQKLPKDPKQAGIFNGKLQEMAAIIETILGSKPTYAALDGCNMNLTNGQVVSGSVSTTVTGTRSNASYYLAFWVLGSKFGNLQLGSSQTDSLNVLWDSSVLYNDGPAILECRIQTTSGDGITIFSKQVTVTVQNGAPTPTPTPTATPVATPSPTPTAAPSPTPGATPTPPPPLGCAGKNGVYCYIVATDRLSYTLWAQLDNKKDPEIYTEPGATCRDTATNPDPGLFNYCARPNL